MEQIVKVRRLLPEGMAEVIRIRESACSGDCHKCAGCGATQQTMLLTARNAIGANPGDLVVVESDTATVLKGAALLYVLPLIVFLMCYIAGETLWGRGILAGIVGFVLGMLPIKLYDRSLAQKGTVYTIKAYAQQPQQPKFTEKGDNEVD
jgi:positive regulator of sigma E activity